MRKELEEKLYKEFPSIFQQHEKTPQETCMCWGCTHGDGWFDILWNACDCIAQHEKWKTRYKESGVDTTEYMPVVFVQVKEKFGTLRIYYNGGDEYTAGVIDMASSLSAITCENCGERGTMQKGGWLYVACPACVRKQ